MLERLSFKFCLLIFQKHIFGGIPSCCICCICSQVFPAARKLKLHSSTYSHGILLKQVLNSPFFSLYEEHKWKKLFQGNNIWNIHIPVYKRTTVQLKDAGAAVNCSSQESLQLQTHISHSLLNFYPHVRLSLSCLLLKLLHSNRRGLVSACRSGSLTSLKFTTVLHWSSARFV